MSNITVKTKGELESALKAGYSRIIVQGALASEFKEKLQKQKRKKKIAAGGALAAGAIAVGSILAAPVTGGASLLGVSAMGLTATGAAGAAAAAGTAATISTSTAVLAGLGLVVGGSLGAYAISKGYKRITFRPDGSVVIEKE